MGPRTHPRAPRPARREHDHRLPGQPAGAACPRDRPQGLRARRGPARKRLRDRIRRARPSALGAPGRRRSSRGPRHTGGLHPRSRRGSPRGADFRRSAPRCPRHPPRRDAGPRRPRAAKRALVPRTPRRARRPHGRTGLPRGTAPGNHSPGHLRFGRRGTTRHRRPARALGPRAARAGLGAGRRRPRRSLPRPPPRSRGLGRPAGVRPERPRRPSTPPRRGALLHRRRSARPPLLFPPGFLSPCPVRLTELRLLRYTVFEDAPPLAFGEAPGRLHLVYGANEAGKTTCLRAISDLLYGYGARLAADDPRQLIDPRRGPLLEGELLSDNGERLRFRRKKGRKGTLVDAAGAPADEAALAALLAGVDRDAFASVWGIDHERLRAGGELLRSRRGLLGEVLAAAASGSPSLQELRTALRDEAERLYHPKRNRSSAFRAARKAYTEARRKEREERAQVGKWEELQRKRRVARERAVALQAELDALRAEERRLGDLERVAQTIDLIEQVSADLAAFGDHRPLPPTYDPVRRAQVQERLLILEERLEATARAEAQRSAELSALPSPAAILEEREAIEALGTRLSALGEAAQRTIAIEQRLAAEESALGRALERVAPGRTVADPSEVLPSATLRARVLDLIAERVPPPRELERNLKDREDELAQVRARRAELPSFGPDPRLAAAIEEAGSAGIDDELRQARAERERLAEEAARAVAALGRWAHDADGLAAAPLPERSAVAEFRRRFADADERERRCQDQLRAAQDEAAEKRRELEVLLAAEAPPNEEDLRAARRLRDAGWALVLAEWRGEGADPDALRAFAGNEALSEAYPRSVEDADRIADRLRREQERVLRRARLERELESLERRVRDLAAEEEQLRGERERLEDAWRALWAASGVAPLDRPEVMAEWLQEAREVLARAEAARAAADRAAALERSRDARRDALRAALAALGRDTPQTPELAPVLAVAKAHHEASRKAQERRQTIEEELERLEVLRARGLRDLEAAREGHVAWQERWSQAMTELGLAADASTRAAQARLAEHEALAQLLAERRRLEEELRDARALVQGFAAEVRRVAQAAGVEAAASGSPEAAYAELARALRAADTTARRRAELEKDLERLRAERARDEEDLRSARAELTRLCREAGVEKASELPAAEARLRAYDALRTKEERARAELAPEQRALDPPALRSLLAGRDVAGLAAERAEVARRAEELGAQRDQAQHEVGRLDEQLRTYDGGAAAARALQEQQAAETRLRRIAERYALLTVASAALDELLERHRGETQEPVLRRAHEHFAALTCGSFAGLTTVLGEEGHEHLLGVRPDAERAQVPFSEMSEGARDQAYLALFLAYVEERLARRSQEGREAVPFVADDVLVSFDEERTAAALCRFADLAARTQVIYFTHHEHLVELAREAVGSERLEVLRLPTAVREA
ncbi:MAG: hypothetical protein D6731_17745 [Planctomycetota bacterium]|nr:MAG: hypothetical protein D6731_17745 [Planctomycetota bacterium]